MTFIHMPPTRSASQSPAKTAADKKNAGKKDTSSKDDAADDAASLAKRRAAVVSTRKKFLVAAWKFIVYMTTSMIGLYVISTEPWAFSRPDYFVGWPEQHLMSPQSKFFYIVGFGSYTYFTISLLIERVSVLDLVVLAIHHIATIFLITGSYFYGFHRIGIMVLALHELADPFMEFAKINLYVGNSKVADVFFALFAMVFLLTRNLLFPGFVISSIHQYAYWEDGSYLPNEITHKSLAGGLWVLALLHVYWGFLIVKMVIHALTNKGVADDIRGDDD
ncbi:TLC domain-containing protein [Entophlyctis helioformis]|nr:TLC domain-containing protein [Entophlyctis helioformis]